MKQMIRTNSLVLRVLILSAFACIHMKYSPVVLAAGSPDFGDIWEVSWEASPGDPGQIYNWELTYNVDGEIADFHITTANIGQLNGQQTINPHQILKVMQKARGDRILEIRLYHVNGRVSVYRSQSYVVETIKVEEKIGLLAGAASCIGIATNTHEQVVISGGFSFLRSQLAVFEDSLSTIIPENVNGYKILNLTFQNSLVNGCPIKLKGDVLKIGHSGNCNGCARSDQHDSVERIYPDSKKPDNGLISKDKRTGVPI